MTIQYLHASKYGNGAAVAAELKRQMAAKGVAVDVHHIRASREPIGGVESTPCGRVLTRHRRFPDA